MLLPIAVSIIAEQLRIAAAQTVLDQRELADAQAVGALPEDEQARVVDAIVARETGDRGARRARRRVPRGARADDRVSGTAPRQAP